MSATCRPRVCRVLQADAAALVVASLDEVAWLFNVRGCDVPCNPVGVAYAAVAADGAWLFVDAHKVPADVQAHLAAAGVVVKPYREALAFVEALGSRDGKVGYSVVCHGIAPSSHALLTPP